jgi:hypothetical protein
LTLVIVPRGLYQPTSIANELWRRTLFLLIDLMVLFAVLATSWMPSSRRHSGLSNLFYPEYRDVHERLAAVQFSIARHPRSRLLSQQRMMPTSEGAIREGSEHGA